MKRTVGHWWIRCTRCGHGERLLGDLVPVGQPDVLFMYVCRDRAGCQEREAAVRRNYYVASEGHRLAQGPRRYVVHVVFSDAPSEGNILTACGRTFSDTCVLRDGLHSLASMCVQCLRRAKSAEARVISDLGQMQVEYWSAFRAYLQEHGSSTKPQKRRDEAVAGVVAQCREERLMVKRRGLVNQPHAARAALDAFTRHSGAEDEEDAVLGLIVALLRGCDERNAQDRNARHGDNMLWLVGEVYHRTLPQPRVEGDEHAMEVNGRYTDLDNLYAVHVSLHGAELDRAEVRGMVEDDDPRLRDMEVCLSDEHDQETCFVGTEAAGVLRHLCAYGVSWLGEDDEEEDAPERTTPHG